MRCCVVRWVCVFVLFLFTAGPLGGCEPGGVGGSGSVGGSGLGGSGTGGVGGFGGGVCEDGTDCDADGLPGSCQEGSCVADPRWLAPEKISTDNDEDAFWPRVVLDDNGNGMVVWQQKSNEVYHIRAKRYSARGGWETAERISNGNGWAEAPRLAIDAAGHAIAVWNQLDGAFQNIWANTYLPTTGWGVAHRIEDNAGDAFYPDVAMSPAGAAMVVWRQSPDGDGYQNIWGRSYTPRGGWGTAMPVELSERGSVNPKVAVDRNGDAIAVWGIFAFDGPRGVWSNRFTANRAWGAVEQLNDPEVNAGAPEVAVDGDGNALAVWTQGWGCSGTCNVWVSQYAPMEGWGSAEAISEGGENSVSPRPAFDSAGRAMLMWIQADEMGTNPWSNRYVPMEGWGHAALVEQTPAGASGLSFALNSEGNAIGAWIEEGEPSSVQAAIYTRAGGWKPSERIDQDGASLHGTDVAIDKLGRGLVLWHQKNGETSEIWGSRFE